MSEIEGYKLLINYSGKEYDCGNDHCEDRHCLSTLRGDFHWETVYICSSWSKIIEVGERFREVYPTSKMRIKRHSFWSNKSHRYVMYHGSEPLFDTNLIDDLLLEAKRYINVAGDDSDIRIRMTW